MPANPTKDVNMDVAQSMERATGVAPSDGADLISDPALRQRFIDAKNEARFKEIASRPLGFIMDLRTFNPRARLVRTK